MNKYALIGFLLCLAGGVIIGFQKIGEMMEREDQWDTLSIDGMLTEEHLNAIQGMDAGILKDTVDFLITSPLWMELMVVGGVFLLISGFIKR